MTVAMRRAARMRVAEFIEWAAPKLDEERWELLDGEPVLMAPQSERHQIIVANLLALLRNPALEQGCRALPGLGILSDTIDDFAPIPDVVVRCGPVAATGYAKDPVFLAEVLSPSTMDTDRGCKSSFYTSLPSLQLFLIVFQNEQRIEVWTRDGDGWRFRACGQGGGHDDSVQASQPAVTLPVADIYAGLTF